MSDLADYQHSPATRDLLRSLANIVCPPQHEQLGVMEPLLDEIELSMRALPPIVRFALTSGMSSYDLAAITRYGTRAGKLSDGRALAYFKFWKSGLGLQRAFIQGIKGLMAMCYYQLPPVLEDIGYTPHQWIDKVHKRRLEAYADDIATHEATVFERDSLPLLSAVATESGAPMSATPVPTAAIHEFTNAKRPPGVFHRDDFYGDTVLGCDVVIVGSGAGGSTAAAELAEAGFDVIVLEEGSYYGTKDFTPNALDMIRKLYRDGGASAAVGRPPILFQEGRTVGGSAVINGGMSWRTPERVLEQWATDYGLPGLRPAALEPYFERVERRIHVAYQDPESLGRDQHLLKAGADELGWAVDRNLRNQLHCAGSNNCAFGCPTGAKQSTLVTYIPRALHFGARVYSNVRIHKINRHGKRATGVEGHVIRANGTRGHRVTVRAKLVISACGSIQTPALLHRSGFRSTSNQLGRNLSMHPNIKVVAVFDEPVRGWEGVHQAFQVREFVAQGIQTLAAVNVPPAIIAMTTHGYGSALGDAMQDYKRCLIAGLSCEDTQYGHIKMIGGVPVPMYDLCEADFERIKLGAAGLCELLFAAGARTIFTAFQGLEQLHCADDAAKIRSQRIPRQNAEIMTVHIMGTARMGGNRSSAVTDGFGRVYDTDGLVVCDASLFPTAVGVNPCESIQALATRNAAHIIEERGRYLQ